MSNPPSSKSCHTHPNQLTQWFLATDLYRGVGYHPCYISISGQWEKYIYTGDLTSEDAIIYLVVDEGEEDWKRQYPFMVDGEWIVTPEQAELNKFLYHGAALSELDASLVDLSNL